MGAGDEMTDKIIRIGYPEFLDTVRIVPYVRFCDAMQGMTEAINNLGYQLRLCKELEAEQHE